MDTIAAVQFRGDVDHNAVEIVKSNFLEVEKLLNVFDPTSEINTFKGFGNEQVLKRCNPKVRKCYEDAFALERDSGGVFNSRWKKDGTIDLGGIAKGFAIDCAYEALKKAGIERDILIDLGGNLRSVKGKWKVAVGEVGNDDIAQFMLSDGQSCATSAEYFRGKHIRDPRTGKPTTGSVRSVTVICDDSATLADGWSTAMFILGKNEGEKVLSVKCPKARAIWFFQEQEGK